MTDCEVGFDRPVTTAEEARVRVGTALALLDVVAEMLDKVPPPETALSLGDPELFRYLQAAEGARSWIVGHEIGNSVDCPAGGSALGDGLTVFAWDDEETERHFASALRDRDAGR